MASLHFSPAAFFLLMMTLREVAAQQLTPEQCELAKTQCPATIFPTTTPTTFTFTTLPTVTIPTSTVEPPFVGVGNDFNDSFIERTESARDLLIIVDGSGSITEDEMIQIGNGIRTLINILCPGFGPEPTKNHMAIMVFSVQAFSIHLFGQGQSTSDLQQAVAEVPLLYQDTCINVALTLAPEFFKPEYGARSSVIRETLLITDGHRHCQGTGNLTLASQTLKALSRVYVLTAGTGYSEDELQALRSIASSPNNFFPLSNFDSFDDMFSYLYDVLQGCA